MILYYFLFFVLAIAILISIFFLFGILFPAMHSQGIAVDAQIFSQKEMHYIVREDVPPEKTDMRAVVLCSFDKTIADERLHFLRGQTCSLINQIYGSLNDCQFSCIGLGDCIKMCPQDAIVIENGTAIVTNLCIGCGNCQSACPKKLIKMFHKTELETMLCSADTRWQTSCSECRKMKKIPNISKKGFKFWQSCYRIIH